MRTYVFFIVFQEYECHKDSKVEGLSCLRRQLTGILFNSLLKLKSQN